MKNGKRTHIRVFAAALSVMLFFAGCGHDGGNTDVDERQATVSDTFRGEPDQAPDTDKNSEMAAVNTGESRVEAAAEPEIAEDAYKAFERFLEDQEPLYFDKYNLDGAWNPDTEGFEKRFREKTPYRFEELLEAFVDYNEMFAGDLFEMGRVEYAYIDCGADSVPELAVRIADYETCDETLLMCDKEVKEV